LKNSNDFKFDITIAFVIFAFLLVVSVTYTAIYIFSNLTTEEFKDKVKISADNIYYFYKQKENTVENTTLALAKNDIFNASFNVNPSIIKSVFKTMLLANANLKEIEYYNQYGQLVVGCEKFYKNAIYCYNTKNRLISDNFKLDKLFVKEKIKGKDIIFTAISPIFNSKKGLIRVKAIINDLPINSELYYILFINSKGKIYYSTSSVFSRVNSIYDLFNYTLADKIIKTKQGFVTDDIYVKTFSPNFKVVFIQNKNVISKTNEASQKLALFMIIISIFVAIPLGVFFSKPLYRFYEELDKRVKEEIEKRQQKEQLLMHQSKLAALGEMLGNIAHQWRHPLTRLSLIIQNMEMAFKMGKLDEKRFEKLKNAAQMQIEYMSETIDDFTNFFKKDTKKVEFCPKEIITEALKLIEGRLKQNGVKVEMNIIKTEPLYGYKTEYSQVVLNILNNAIDVLKERKVENKKIKITIEGKKVSIEDNAGGIPEEIMDKIFEPYFTTKFQSQGTGIGLYMSKVIITQHFKGELYAYNSDKGAVFVIDLTNI
jgi:signal transduction histidine kinase